MQSASNPSRDSQSLFVCQKPLPVDSIGKGMPSTTQDPFCFQESKLKFNTQNISITCILYLDLEYILEGKRRKAKTEFADAWNMRSEPADACYTRGVSDLPRSKHPTSVILYSYTIDLSSARLAVASCTCGGRRKVSSSPAQCMASNLASPSLTCGKLWLWHRSTCSHDSTRYFPRVAWDVFGAWTRRSMRKFETVANPIRDPRIMSVLIEMAMRRVDRGAYRNTKSP